MFSATAASKSNSGVAAGAGCWLMAANARLCQALGATTLVSGGDATRVSIECENVLTPGISPNPSADEQGPAPPLEPGEKITAEADGVVLGWQPRTILIWWSPGVIFIALAWLQTKSILVTLGLAFFCIALFAFYAFDREVQPRSSRKRYVVTDHRLLIGEVDRPDHWRPVELGEVSGTVMEEGLADRIVRRMSGAATIVLEFNSPGPKGEPRRLRIGPMRQPENFRHAIDTALSPLRSQAFR